MRDLPRRCSDTHVAAAEKKYYDFSGSDAGDGEVGEGISALVFEEKIISENFFRYHVQKLIWTFTTGDCRYSHRK